MTKPKKKVLVTGGAGFIGSHIAKALLETDDYSVAIADDLSGGFIENVPEGVRFFNADLRYEAPTEHVMATFSPSIIVHCAANAREGASYFQPRSIVQRNTLAFTNTLSYGLHRNRLEHFLLMSSMAVYGNQEPPFTEEMPTKPVDIYGMQKEVMEKMLVGFADVYGFKYTIIRPHNQTGPNQSLCDPFRNVIGIWMNRIMRNEPVVVFGDGEQKRAFSYIGDSLPVYLKAIKGEIDYDIINVGGLEEVTINEALSYVKEAMDVAEDYPTEYLPDRPKEVKYAYCDHKRMLEILDGSNHELDGWKVGVQRMAAWAKSKGPQKWKRSDDLEITDHKQIPKVWKN